MKKVFIAGANGAVGQRMVPRLIKHGYEVTAMVRSLDKVGQARALGAKTVVADALNRDEVMRAVAQAKPDVVIHQLTALSRIKNFKKFDNDFAMTNRLRTESTDYLIAAAQEAGATRFLAQSYGGWTYERTGDALKTEESAFDPNPPANQRKSLEAIRYLEDKTVNAKGMTGIAFRYANFYGPGTSFDSRTGSVTELVRKHQLPLLGDAAGVWSFIHLDDVASAAIAGIERGHAGIYNIVDDDPAPTSVWIPELARILGAKKPMHMPVWLGRLFIGEVGVSMMTQIRGVSNEKAKRELEWMPQYKSWRDGFRRGIGDLPIPDDM
jgi:nucleoside-diphosphate-sugar epimerase